MTSNSVDDAAAAALGASLAGIITKHKQQTVSIKAARSWQFRARRGVNNSWAKIAKKKSLSGALPSFPEHALAGQPPGADEPTDASIIQERKLRYEKQKAEEKSRGDALRAKIVSEVSMYDMDDSVTFDDLFAREVVKAVDSLRTRQESESESSDDEGELNKSKKIAPRRAKSLAKEEAT